jgi:ABC-type branched-subunit amino acid transport system ATPase component
VFFVLFVSLVIRKGQQRSMTDVALRVERLKKSFGGLAAVNGPSFEVAQGEITGLIGPNGSGKTTVFNLITGVLRADGGAVYLGDQNITGWSPHRIAQAGLGRTFQISRVFGQMTLWENMLVVARGSEAEAGQRAEELLRLVNLWDLRDKFGADTSYGQQKLLEFARVLMLEPSVILLDEPFAGVNPTMRQTMLRLIEQLKIEGKTIFIVDHEMTIIMSLCQRLIVLDQGEKIAEGVPAAIQQDERVLEAYFGRRRTTLSP